MDQKNMGTQECVKGGADACSPHLGHHPSCGHVQANPRVNTKQQQAMRDALEASMMGMNGGAQQVPGMYPGVSGPPMAPQYPQMTAGYPAGLGPMPPQGPYGAPAAPQRVAVDVMGQSPAGGAWGGHGPGWGGPPPNGNGVHHPQLGPGVAPPPAAPGVAIANVVGSSAPTTRTERLERASLAIFVALVRTGTQDQFQQGAHVLATDAVRAARALIDEIDATIQRS